MIAFCQIIYERYVGTTESWRTIAIHRHILAQVVDYESGKYVSVGDGDLVVRDLEWSDMGMHKCVARNEFGEDMREAFLYPLAQQANQVNNVCTGWTICFGKELC